MAERIPQSIEYRSQLHTFHQLSERHVFIVEADVSEDGKRELFHYADKVRRAGNALAAVMRKNMEQLFRTKRYRGLQKAYGKAAESSDETARKQAAKQMAAMQRDYSVTWNDCRKAMIPIAKRYGIDAVFGLTKAEDVWSGVEACLYKDGKTIHFSKREDLPCIRAKQINRGIILRVKDNALQIKFGRITFGLKTHDRFEADEANAIMHYLEQPEVIDRNAVRALFEDRGLVDTYRPCYASLVCKEIRGRLRVYVHITVEGKAKPKYNKDGTLRHKYGKGVIGCDIGTQTIAYTSDTEVGLKNLAERGRSIEKSERMERLLYRAMDRSRRAMNPENYNPDGTVKKGPKKWKRSKRCIALQKQHKELCRINAENRRLAINEDINYLRSIGNVFVTEPPNAKKLQRRVKQTTVSEKGKCNRKKRFGKSIKNRCPGTFRMKAKQVFQSTGGTYMEVSNHYRASQYDHTADEYIKKKLSQRMYNLRNGTKVQRDCYASFLLYCINQKDGTIDKDKCNNEFDKFWAKENALIEEIRSHKIKVMNSGIKIA